MKIAVFPGTFDPFTIGHKEIIDRALPLFDKIIIALGYNINKQKSGFLPLELRQELINEIFVGETKIEVQKYTGLTTDFCKQQNAKFILRGVRNIIDFEYEKEIANINQNLVPEIETVILFSSLKNSFISSSMVREIISNNGDAKNFVPKEILTHL